MEERRHGRPARRQVAALGAEGDRQGQRRRTPPCSPRSRRCARWVGAGAHRIDHDDDGTYDQADAVRIMDAWWPLLGQGRVPADAGAQADSSSSARASIHDAPGPIGSAFQNDVYGFVKKDLGRPRREGPGPLLARLLRQGQVRRLPQAPPQHARRRRPPPRPRTSTAPRAANSTTAPRRSPQMCPTPSTPPT